MAGNKPRIAYVTHNLNPGGTERLVVDMSRALSDSYEVDVVCLDEPGTWADELRNSGISVFCVWRSPGLDLSIIRRLAVLFRQRRTDIIHAHQCTPWFYCALSRLLNRGPRLLLEEHGRFYPEQDDAKKRFVNRAIIRRLTHGFVAVSEDVRRRLIRYEGIPESERIDVIYNGTQWDSNISDGDRRELREALGFATSDFVVGTIGRFDEIKNLPMLIEGIAGARQRSKRVRGLLVGHGPIFEEIRDLASSLGLDDAIVFAGYRDDAKELVQCLDLFVLSSFSEGTSMALLEAMAGGSPVAVTDVGGNPEIVEKGQTGWVFPSDCPGELTEIICEAINDPEKTSRFAAAGRDRYREEFTFDRMIRKYRSIYNELCATAPESPRSLTQE
jgi:glycosyltransferase involved in cell wall biosynthesis